MEYDSSVGSDVPPVLDDAAFIDLGVEIQDVAIVDDMEMDMEDAVDMWEGIEAPPIQEVNLPSSSSSSSSSDDSMAGHLGTPLASPDLPNIAHHAYPNPIPLDPVIPVEHPYVAPNLLDWRFVLRVLAVFVAIGSLTLLVLILLSTQHKNPELPPKENPGLPLNKTYRCNITMSVSKNGTSNFRTISEAVKASPNNCPLKVCIFIGEGEYHERVVIGHEKINLILIGEGAENTSIISNVTHGVNAATLCKL